MKKIERLREAGRGKRSKETEKQNSRKRIRWSAVPVYLMPLG